MFDDLNQDELLNNVFSYCENSIYGALLDKIFEETDDTTRSYTQSLVVALNKRGVPTKTVFDAFLEVARNNGG